MQNSAAREPVTCPICGQPLKRTADRWLSAFECDRCGQFSDFGDALTSAGKGRRAGQMSRPPEPPSSES
jgi:endogenous inhibitor of DNA gyrase (YacG/DUF329 family)